MWAWIITRHSSAPPSMVCNTCKVVGFILYEAALTRNMISTSMETKGVVLWLNSSGDNPPRGNCEELLSIALPHVAVQQGKLWHMQTLFTPLHPHVQSIPTNSTTVTETCCLPLSTSVVHLCLSLFDLLSLSSSPGLCYNTEVRKAC